MTGLFSGPPHDPAKEPAIRMLCPDAKAAEASAAAPPSQSPPRHSHRTSAENHEPPITVRGTTGSNQWLLRGKDRTDTITYASQSQLPRLPIPTLEETLDKFPRVLEALQNEEEQEETRRICQDFLVGEGPLLQKALNDYEEEGRESGYVGSYVEEFWNESYLSPEGSVVLNLNPYFVLESGPDPKTSKDQLKRAASLCFASLKLASALKHETLKPDIFRGKPLCMDQFKTLFGSSRQPADEHGDDVHVYKDSNHVLVLCKNQFYYFQALCPDTGHVAVDEHDIFFILKAVQKNAEKAEPCDTAKSAIGVLTSLPRRAWAAARRDFCQASPINQTALHVIDSALFVLVLDDFVPANKHEAAANMLHGTNQLEPTSCGWQIGTCMNRWYDKLQIFVCKDGTSGVNFEHSVVDGHTALRFVSDVFAETVILFAESIIDTVHGRGTVPHVIEATVQRAADILSSKGKPLLDVYPKKVAFDLAEEKLQKRIYYAETNLCDQIIASDTCVLEFHDYGKRLIVSNKISPDSFVQMTIMLAYYKLYGEVVCTYEPVLTKHFFHGRTEAMRSATPQVRQLCELWCDRGSTTDQEKLDALRQAATAHSTLVKESAIGRGVDRHLFSLRCMAERLNMPIPAFFESEAWKALNHTVLSTSNCGNPALKLFGFGPVVSDGFGIGYIIKDNGLSFSVSSKHRQTQRYVGNLYALLKEIQQLLKPLSSVTVEHQAPMKASKNFKRQVSFVDNDYGDPWGCSMGLRELAASSAQAPVPPSGGPVEEEKKEKEKPEATSAVEQQQQPEPYRRNPHKRLGSGYFAQVQEVEFNIQDIPVSLNLELDSSSNASEEDDGDDYGLGFWYSK